MLLLQVKGRAYGAPPLERARIWHMTPGQIEALVLAAIDRVRSGSAKEDDLIEFKRAWPPPERARSLAASANTARGESIIYVIGVDESDGSIHATGDVDPAKWFAQLEAKFDEVFPILERHLIVQVTENEVVQALQFQTDRAPYVVTVSNGGQTEREVPIRAGARTRSAHRRELLRLLGPSTPVPNVEVLEAQVHLHGPDIYGGSDNYSIGLRVEVYFEHTGTASIFIPRRFAKARLSIDGFSIDRPISYSASTHVRSTGVVARWDGIEVIGSGSIWLDANLDLAADTPSAVVLAAVESWRVEMSFRIAGSDRLASSNIDVGNRQDKTEMGELWDVTWTGGVG